MKLLCTLISASVLVTAADRRPLDAQNQPTPPLVLDSRAGSEAFRFYCASCHGITGRGDGPAANALKTRPPDLTSLARQNGGTFPRDRIRSIVMGSAGPLDAHGSRDMPVWGVVFWALDASAPSVRLRIDTIVAHIESLQEPSAAPGRSGAQLYRIHCATCHGSNARGDGPLARQLRRAPPDLTSYTERNNGVGRDVLSHGDREMPVWGDAFRAEPDGLTADEAKARIGAILGYLRAIQRRDAD
jgi:mono/diheme cytochrome c family protein